MADRAEIKVTLDAKQAKGEAARARRQLADNEQKVRDQLRRRRRQEDGARRSARKEGAPGSAIGIAGISAGVAAARGAVGKAVTAGALALGAFEGLAEAGAIGATVLTEVTVRPIVDTLLRDLLPELAPAIFTDELADRAEFIIQEKLKEYISDARRLARFEAITKQVARTQVVGVALDFERAGEGFTLSQGANLSENFVRAAARKNFLSEAESQRNQTAVAKMTRRGLVAAIGKAFGE